MYIKGVFFFSQRLDYYPMYDYLVKQILNLDNPALKKCSLSLGDSLKIQNCPWLLFSKLSFWAKFGFQATICNMYMYIYKVYSIAHEICSVEHEIKWYITNCNLLQQIYGLNN